MRLRAMEEALDGPPPCQSLHEAVVALDKPAVAWFLQRQGDSVMQRDDDMRTPLLLAAAAGDCTTCTLLIRRMAAYDADSINWPDASGLTPLHWACTQQRVDAVALLLQHAAVRSSTPTALLLPTCPGPRGHRHVLFSGFVCISNGILTFPFGHGGDIDPLC